MEAQHRRDFLEIENAVKDRIKYLDILNLSEEEINIRKNEMSILLEKVSNIRKHRVEPLKSIQSSHGTIFKIGDSFHIPGDELSTYQIVLFPDSVTIRGQAKNPAIGKPWVCEVYVEEAVKIEKKKEKKIKQSKKPKKVKIEIGDYFRLITNNTIYKAIEVSKKKVVGTNELKSKTAHKRVKTKLTEIILKTKKDYKKQHKAEKNFKIK